jgi:hypothetical protein
MVKTPAFEVTRYAYKLIYFLPYTAFKSFPTQNAMYGRRTMAEAKRRREQRTREEEERKSIQECDANVS